MAEIQNGLGGGPENTLRFLDMVSLFGSQAMIGLGKLANPATGKSEKNLLAARLFIDTLETIEIKTKGNLTAEESKVLQGTLTDLRLMFVEESKNTAPTKKESEEKTETEKTDAKSTKIETPEQSESKVKFHKTYES